MKSEMDRFKVDSLNLQIGYPSKFFTQKGISTQLTFFEVNFGEEVHFSIQKGEIETE